MRRKLPTLALAVALTLGLVPLLLFSSQPLVSAFSGSGSGTAGDPYIIENVDHLQEMKDNLTAHYALGNDIDASDTPYWNGMAGFEPIGTITDNFTGTFDGRGYEISDLYMERDNNVGLFGFVGSGGVVENVGVNAFLAYCENLVGILVGYNYGTVSNCYSTGNVDGNYYVGGLVGWNGGTVSNCYSTGIVSGSGNDVGKLVGWNHGTVSNCYSTGSVEGNDSVGGLVGYNSSVATVSNSYSTSSVSGDTNVGGLVGWNHEGTVTNCYSIGTVSGIESVGGLVGYNDGGTVDNSFWDNETSGQATSAGGTGKTTENMKDVRTYTDNTWSEGLTTPWDFFDNPYGDVENENIWSIVSSYPFLSWQIIPNPPTSLWCEGSANPTQITDLTPEFSAIGTDNGGDQMDYYSLQVDDDSGFGSTIWNQAKTAITAFDNNTRCSDISYAGSSLARGTTYFWRIKFWDNNGLEGAWSTETATFKINRLPITSDLKTDGQTNPLHITTLTPTFSWTYSDPDDDNQSHWQVWVGMSSGTNDNWNSGELAGTDNSDVYDGSALSRGVTYYAQVRTKDNFEWSDWATGTFRINQLPTQTYSEQSFFMDSPYTPTLKWWFSDPDGDTQLGVKIQVDNDAGFGSLLWDYSDNTTAVQSKVYAGEALEIDVTYYARVQVRDGYEWSGTWSENTFTILPIPSLVVTEITVDNTPVDRKAHWAGDDDIRIFVTVADNEGRDDIENAYLWIRDNSDAVVVDNVTLTSYENVDADTKRFRYDYDPDDILLDNALGEFDVKVQAVSTYFENTKDYTDIGFKLFKVDDHAITFSPVREIYAEGEIITFEPTVKSVATELAVDNAYLKLELISELGEVLRTIEGYTNGSGKLATHTTLLEFDIGYYDVRISTSKGKIDGLKLYEDAFNVVTELLVSVESITPSDDAVSGLLRSRSIVPEDVVVKVKVFDVGGVELLDLTSDSLRVENIAPQLKSWEVSYGLTLAEGTYSYRVEVWTADLDTMYHVAFAEVRLAVAPSQQAVGDWISTDTIETKEGQFDVVLYRESIVTNPETVDKSNFLFKESIPAPQGSTVMVKVSGLPATMLTVDTYGMITKYFDVSASTTVRIEMEVTITDAVKIEALGETEVVAAVPRTVEEHEYKITNLTSTTLREMELTFPVSGVISVVDEDGVPIVKFWEAGSTAVEIAILEPYGEMILTLTAELAPDIWGVIDRLINWTVIGIPIIIPLLVLGVILAALTWGKTGPVSKVILLLLPLGVFVGLLLLGVI